LVDKYNDLVDRCNKQRRRLKHIFSKMHPVGGPIAASEGQEDEIIKHHKRGKFRPFRLLAITLTVRRSG
jgi:hypothetical protein